MPLGRWKSKFAAIEVNHLQRNLSGFCCSPGGGGGSGYIYLRTWNCLDSLLPPPPHSSGESIWIPMITGYEFHSIRKIRAFSSLPLFASDNCYRNSNYCFLRSSSQGTICRELINGQRMRRCKMHIPCYWIPFNRCIETSRVNFFPRILQK